MGSITSNQGQNALKSQAEDLIKQHLVYDGSGRVTDIYTTSAIAPAAGSDGAPCTHVQYQYSAVSGQTTLVTGMKESIASWNASWDF